ncbi:MAG: peptide-methionine (S)-S-oxide reductase MsrA [Candidatus Kerfeldbacteria bacterium]|nr:peptide-methionine (S)-S-oxide reductase MsrA [Candidatus Kerfeldbacteria bacterium]
MGNVQIATFGGGCFWCTEAMFKELRGVRSVMPGYAGGTMDDPGYEQVSSGRTGHAEAIRIEFDPSAISYQQLVEVFFLTHDPTQLNRQGHDVGEQYRSVIFFHDDEQRRIAEAVKGRLEREKVFDKSIVTAIVPAEKFFPAEDYHRDYYAKNPDQPYCQVVITPKLASFRKKFVALRKQ